MPDVGVVYLYRHAEGENPVRNFLDSYRHYQAGIEHDLYVIFKGFPDQTSLASARALFEDLPINPIMLDDTGYDIGAYIAAANTVSNRRLIFLNTFSQILAANWLSIFDHALSLSDAGIVGATGSWETYASDIEGAILEVLNNIKYLPANIRNRVTRGGNTAGRDTTWQRPKRPLKLYLFSPLYYLYYLYECGRFPNPHVRTNAFMIERDRFLSLRVSSFASKNDVYRFESGRRSMTRQIRTQGLRPLVVDRMGNAYDVTEWKMSLTFRVGAQVNLLVADNRTRDFEFATGEFRRILENQAWVHPWLWDI